MDSDFSIELSDDNSVIESNREGNDTRRQIILKLFELFIRHKWTLKSLQDAATLLNSMPGTNIQLPKTKYGLLKELMSNAYINIVQYIQCEKCGKYTECCYTNKKKASACEECDQKFKKDNFFVYFRVKEQVEAIIEKNFDNLEYCESLQNEANITDTYSAEYIRKIKQKDENVYSMILNTDGVATVRSNTSSLWPIILICNFLPPQLRFKNENIIVAALYHGKEKPNIHDFFQPLVEEFESLSSTGIFVRNRYFKISVTHAIFDLPAKSSISQITQFNGEHACNSCLQLGEKTSKGIRYTYKSALNLRTHSSMMRDIAKVNATPNVVIRGIKGLSPMIAFKNFDMSKSFCIDYMHCVLLGITNNMLDFWTSTNNKREPFYITKQKRGIFNLRVLQIKPPSYLSRRPRPIKYLKQYKASEFRSMLLYFLPIILDRLLPNKYIQHFCLLSSSIYTLLKPAISNEDLMNAEKKLNTFVKLYQEYYGKACMTMNVHSLLHLAQFVRNFGPLWTFSMLPFEAYNGLLKTFIVAPTDILHQITIRYVCHKTIIFNNESDANLQSSVLKDDINGVTLEPQHMTAIEELGISADDEQCLKYFSRLVKNGITFTSKLYTRAKSTVDYYISTANGRIGVVQFYFEFNHQQYAVIETLEVYEVLDQFSKFYFTSEYTVISAGEIVERYIHLEVQKQHFIVTRPNSFERN